MAADDQMTNLRYLRKVAVGPANGNDNLDPKRVVAAAKHGAVFCTR